MLTLLLCHSTVLLSWYPVLPARIIFPSPLGRYSCNMQARIQAKILHRSLNQLLFQLLHYPQGPFWSHRWWRIRRPHSLLHLPQTSPHRISLAQQLYHRSPLHNSRHQRDPQHPHVRPIYLDSLRLQYLTHLYRDLVSYLFH